jgi:ABC-type uncharacterized transport system permease subunit
MNEFAALAQLTVVAMVPYLLASLGTMLGGLAGVFSVSQEGIMLLGASVGFLVSYSSGSTAVGILLAAAVGAVFGFALGWATTALRLDQFVVGLALFFAATGLAGLLYRIVIGQTGTTPLVDTLPRVEIPLLSDIPLLGTALFSHNVLVYFAALLTVGLWFYLYRTGWLAIALTFFGGWRPQFIAAGALFFATMDVVALRAEVSGIDIPSQVLLVIPYVATLVVMVFAFRWARVPEFLGRNYDRESRTG